MDQSITDELKRILTLSKAELTPEDIGFLKARQNYLTEDQKKIYAEISAPVPSQPVEVVVVEPPVVSEEFPTVVTGATAPEFVPDAPAPQDPIPEPVVVPVVEVVPEVTVVPDAAAPVEMPVSQVEVKVETVPVVDIDHSKDPDWHE